MKVVIVKSSLIILSYLIAVFTAVYFGLLYSYLFPYAIGGGFIGAPGTWEWIIGFPLSVIFILTFLTHSYSGKHVWLWNVIGAVPAILFEVTIDPLHIYFPIILGLIAWGLGTLTHKVLRQTAPAFKSKIL